MNDDNKPEANSFVADFPTANLKGDIASLEFPFFSLSKSSAATTRIYERGGIRIEVLPSSKGFPTIWDKAILLYAGAHLVKGIDAGRTPSRSVAITPYDLLKATSKAGHCGGRDYRDLVDSLDRLRGRHRQDDHSHGRSTEHSGLRIHRRLRISGETSRSAQLDRDFVSLVIPRFHQSRSVDPGARVLSAQRRTGATGSTRLSESTWDSSGAGPSTWTASSSRPEVRGASSTISIRNAPAHRIQTPCAPGSISAISARRSSARPIQIRISDDAPRAEDALRVLRDL